MENQSDRARLRLNQIPVLYVKGSHATVGFTIGRQFKTQIHDALEKSDSFKQYVLPSYGTEHGKRIYDTTLETCKKRFPNYLLELEGIAKGSDVPFHKLFLLHLELTVSTSNEAKIGETGCSSILSNNKDLIIGHTEDAPLELLNNVFIVCAEIIGENGKRLEKFSTLAYAGCLPGYTMGFNEHGFVHTINTLYPLENRPGKTPRAFIARALLAASNLEEVMDILKNKGDGISDGFSLNAHFAKCGSQDPLMYNIEVCPNPDPDGDESLTNLVTIARGETYVHCNKFLRIKTSELPRAHVSSMHRHEAIQRHPKPETVEIVKNILSDRSDPTFAVFRLGDKEPDLTVTVAVGIFDISNRQWRIYSEQPTVSDPIAVLPLNF